MIAVIDIESTNWDNFLGLGYFDGKRYKQFNSIDSFMEFLKHEKQQTIYAHNGGKFDFLFFMKWFFPEDSKNNEHPKNIILVNGSIISFEYKNITFRDSIAIMPGGLRKIASFFGQKKLSIDYESIEQEDWQEYLKVDCIILWECVTRYIEFFEEKFDTKPGLTIASTAMKVYRKHFSKIPVWKSFFESDTRNSYLGGRCEIFKMRGKRLNVYDINSMYPAVMKNYAFPVGYPKKRRKNFDLAIASNNNGLICADVFVPDCYIPILPIRERGKMLFLTGPISGVWTLAEFRLAVSAGLQINKIHWTIDYSCNKYIFKDWVDYIYTMRKNSSNDGIKYILKILLNSLYGKFAQRPEKEKILMESELTTLDGVKILSAEHGILSQKINSDSDFMIPIISAHVTSYGRMELYKYLNENSYYCDTDSVVTTERIPESTELGFMKLEKENQTGEFWLPKLYKLHGKDKVICKAKGFSKVNEEVFDRIIQKECIESKGLLSFKESIIQHKPFATRKNLTKQIRASYNKRRILSDSDTIPYTLKQWRELWAR